MSEDKLSGSQTASHDRLEHPRELVQTAAARLLPLVGQEHHEDLLAGMQQSLQRLELGIFRLVVMGEIKKGKSSFINALLGEPDLLPTASDVATSTVYKLLYGPEQRIKAFFLPDVDSGRRVEPHVIDRDELPSYGTEDGNPGNTKRVDFIGIELPNPLLKQGLVLIDTPGVGGLFKAHRDITWRYAPNADAVFFVLDSVEAVISADEIRFLKELIGKVTKRVFFVQSKIDACDTEQWRAWADRNRSILRDKLGIASERLYYFPLSAKLKLLADADHSSEDLRESGFLPLLRFLHQGLMLNKEREIATDTARRLATIARKALGEQEEQLRIARQTSVEQIQQIEAEYREALSQHQAWEASTFQAEVQRFGDRFSDLRRQMLARFQDELDPTGTLMADVMSALRSEAFEPKQLNESAGMLQQEFVARCSEIVLDIQGGFNRDVLDLIRETTACLCPDANPGDVSDSITARGIEIHQPDSLHMQFNVFDSTRNRLYGGLAGATIGQVAAWALGGIFPPAALIAPFVGAAIGFEQSGQSQTEKRREEAINRMRALLVDTLRQAQRQAVRQFEDIASTYERRARDAFRRAADQMKAELQGRLQDVQDARTRSQTDAQTKIAELQQRRDAIGCAVKPLAGLVAGRVDQ